ncbi:DUF6311 domain-containing protein [Candidatus Contubernalis alkaliaceticus]|uniref:DUF6311 domain-containing protein n=1 Tax=Candidatus Contubernalis alkaliaceticus TaxID=338645 RepID=UPI001F4C4128|nr:DUF6311 domain-containing protein [Candidatus Contubernalis alkalaceticus]UNC93485.1 hypothetical protein HUE98_16215 [Candidatus Contubernalis alkalaceticus]
MKTFKASRREFVLESILGVFAGAAVFLFLYGPYLLNPMYTDWLMNSGDLTQHFLGWEFFRSDAWRFPLGVTLIYGFPVGISIVYTDSIPLFAFIFKLIQPVLPADFQYFGLFGIVSFCLQGLFASLLVRRWTQNRAVILFVTVFFLLSPVMIFRMFVHTALAAHWVILAALYLFFTRKENNSLDIALWIILHVTAITLHAYLTLMVLIIFLGYLINNYLQYKDALFVLKLLISNTCMLLFTAWASGYFTVKSNAVGGGLGLYSMNLNALINPQGWSTRLYDLPTYGINSFWGQYEGFQYLGLGMIFLLFLAAVLSFLQGWEEKKNDRRSGTVFILLTCLILSLSPMVTLGQHILIEYPVPDIVYMFWSIFRASGRLFWPVYYLLFLWIFYRILNSRIDPKKAAAVIGIMLLVQLWDLSGIIAGKRDHYHHRVEYTNPLQSNFWREAAGSYKNILLLPPGHFVPPHLGYEAFAYYGAKNSMTLNAGYFARTDIAVEEYAQEQILGLQAGNMCGDSIYVFKDFSLMNNFNALIQDQKVISGMADGYFIMAYRQDTGNIINRGFHKVKAVEEIQLQEYLDLIEDHHIIFITVNEEAFGALKEESVKKMRDLGFAVDPREHEGHSYYGIGGKPVGEKSIEAVDEGILEKTICRGEPLGNYISSIDIHITSGESVSSLFIDGQQYSPNQRGVNVVLYDMQENRVTEIASFDAGTEARGTRIILK